MARRVNDRIVEPSRVPENNRFAGQLRHAALDEHVEALRAPLAQSFNVSTSPTRATFCRVRPSLVVLPRSSVSTCSNAWIVRQRSCSTVPGASFGKISMRRRNAASSTALFPCFLALLIQPWSFSTSSQFAISASILASGFIAWLEKRGYVTGENPWSRQRFDTRNGQGSAAKRPFTDDEVARLLTGIVAQPLADMCRVAALTGMRINEIAELRAGDVGDGEIAVRKGKTKAAVRSIPIHPDISAILKRRTDGKPATADVFHEIPPQRSAERGRAAPVGQAFVKSRRNLGVDERAEGVRQSAVDFHSFRRWFDRKALDAFARGARGFTPWTLAR